VVRKRPKPGERRVQILQALAAMLEQPGADRITTAALAARLSVSEAALYRHFASKAQMFEGLIEFIEQSVFTWSTRSRNARRSASQWCKARPVAVNHDCDGVAFRREKPRHDPRHGGRRTGVRERAAAAAHEPVLRQDRGHAAPVPACLSDGSGSATPSVDAQVLASALTAFLVGRLHRFARSGFKRLPSEHLDAAP
jgi:TetR/AcrR family transcriptional regulator